MSPLVQRAVGDATGRRRTRSSFVGHRGRSPIDTRARGPCPSYGKRKQRVSHSSLDGAQNAPPTTAHKAFLFITEEARKRNDYDYNNALHSRRLIDNTDVPASLRSDHDGLE